MKNLLTAIIASSTLGLLIITLFSLFGDQSYRFELMSHFRVQYIGLFLVAAAFFVFLNKKWLLIALVGLCVNLIAIAPIYFPSPKVKFDVETDSTPRQLSIVFANVRTSNREYQLLYSAITQRQSDLIVLAETDVRWLNYLRKLDANYPYHKLVPRSDNFGIAVYSKHPLQHVSIEDFSGNGTPSISASITVHDQKIRIIAVHPGPPLTESAANRQRLHFDNLTKMVRSENSPVVVAGDFNSSLFSPRYKKLIRKTALVNARQGKGVYPSWARGRGVRRILSIPIDHILVSPTLDAVHFETLAYTGSDHLPIYAEIRF